MTETSSKDTSRMTQRPRVVVVGAGFGGLTAAKALANAPVEVILIDQHNYHSFSRFFIRLPRPRCRRPISHRQSAQSLAGSKMSPSFSLG